MKKEDNGAVPLSSRRRPTTSSGSKKGGEEAEAEAEADVGAAADRGRASSAARSSCRRGRGSRESQQRGVQLVGVGQPFQVPIFHLSSNRLCSVVSSGVFHNN